MRAASPAQDLWQESEDVVRVWTVSLPFSSSLSLTLGERHRYNYDSLPRRPLFVAAATTPRPDQAGSAASVRARGSSKAYNRCPSPRSVERARSRERKRGRRLAALPTLSVLSVYYSTLRSVSDALSSKAGFGTYPQGEIPGRPLRQGCCGAPSSSRLLF